MTNLNAGKTNFNSIVPMKRMLCLLLSAALITAWSPSGFAARETDAGPGPAVFAFNPATGGIDGVDMTLQGIAISTLNVGVIGALQNVYTNNIAGV